jgi:hypothetical protein
MPIHPAMAGKFHLLEGVSTLRAFLEDPVMEERRSAFDEYPGYEMPAVATRMEVKTMLHGFLNLPPTLEPVSRALGLIAASVSAAGASRSRC